MKRWMGVSQALEEYGLTVAELIRAQQDGLQIYDSSGFVLLENVDARYCDPPQGCRWLSIPAERLTPWTKTPYFSFTSKLFTEQFVFYCKIKSADLQNYFPDLVNSQSANDKLREETDQSPVADIQDAPVVMSSDVLMVHGHANQAKDVGVRKQAYLDCLDRTHETKKWKALAAYFHASVEGGECSNDRIAEITKHKGKIADLINRGESVASREGLPLLTMPLKRVKQKGARPPRL